MDAGQCIIMLAGDKKMCRWRWTVRIVVKEGIFIKFCIQQGVPYPTQCIWPRNDRSSVNKLETVRTVQLLGNKVESMFPKRRDQYERANMHAWVWERTGQSSAPYGRQAGKSLRP